MSKENGGGIKCPECGGLMEKMLCVGKNFYYAFFCRRCNKEILPKKKGEGEK